MSECRLWFQPTRMILRCLSSNTDQQVSGFGVIKSVFNFIIKMGNTWIMNKYLYTNKLFYCDWNFMGF